MLWGSEPRGQSRSTEATVVTAIQKRSAATMLRATLVCALLHLELWDHMEPLQSSIICYAFCAGIMLHYGIHRLTSALAPRPLPLVGRDGLAFDAGFSSATCKVQAASCEHLLYLGRGRTSKQANNNLRTLLYILQQSEHVFTQASWP